MRRPQKPKFAKPQHQQQRAGQTPKQSAPHGSSGCTRCGYAREHPRAECKARDARCGKCNKVGHHATLCRSTAVIAAAEAFDAPTETPFLGLLVTEEVSPSEVDIRVDDTPTRFKIDTGADVTCVPELVYAQLGTQRSRQVRVSTFWAPVRRISKSSDRSTPGSTSKPDRHVRMFTSFDLSGTPSWESQLFVR